MGAIGTEGRYDILSNPRKTYLTPPGTGFLPRETAWHHQQVGQMTRAPRQRAWRSSRARVASCELARSYFRDVTLLQASPSSTQESMRDVVTRRVASRRRDRNVRSRASSTCWSRGFSVLVFHPRRSFVSSPLAGFPMHVIPICPSQSGTQTVLSFTRSTNPSDRRYSGVSRREVVDACRRSNTIPGPIFRRLDDAHCVDSRHDKLLAFNARERTRITSLWVSHCYARAVQPGDTGCFPALEELRRCLPGIWHSSWISGLM